MLVKGSKHRFHFGYTLVDSQKKNQVDITIATSRINLDCFSISSFGWAQIAGHAMCETKVTKATRIVWLERRVTLPKLNRFLLRRLVFRIAEATGEFVDRRSVIFITQLAQ